MARRAAIQPASQSVLKAAADLAVSMATDEDGATDDALARSVGSAMGALISAAVTAGEVTPELKESMKEVDERLPAVAAAISVTKHAYLDWNMKKNSWLIGVIALSWLRHAWGTE